jgi:hypothetical protein
MSIVLLGSTSGSVTLQEPAIAGTTTINLPATSGTVGLTTGQIGMKNRIINGAMVIDQRNAGASVTQTGLQQYITDRWNSFGSVTSKFSSQQNAGSVTPPVGFTNYLGNTSLSAYTVGTGEAFQIKQFIEGYNIADLAWGTANAATITLSFWVRSSLTGTFSGTIKNSASTRSYPYTYTVSAANTWEQKSVTIAGDTSGTWLTTNGIGISLGFSLGAGASISGTAGAWAGADLYGATGATSVVGTNGATFYITGVQLELGSAATTFDFRSYGEELALCQRYFFTCGLFNFGTNAYYQGYFGGSNAVWNIRYPVQMRATPIAAISQPTQVQYYSQGGAWTNTTIVLQAYNSGGPNWNTGTTDVTVGIASDSTGGGKLLYLSGGASTTLPTITLSAEL